MFDFSAMTALELRDAMRAGKFSCEELTKYYVNRIKTYDQSAGLNSVAMLDPTAIDQARALDTRGDRNLPLFGLPILLKDNIDVAGLPTTAGSFTLADNIAATDAPIVANLRCNGAVILGKTNMTEFANYTTQDMPNGFSSHGGQVRNAYDRGYDSGGSSSGSGVAMSAGFCAAAIGTDTAFSIIACAAQNGVTGLKPAYGSLSGRGIVPISHTLDTPGPMTRSMADALLVYSAMRNTPIAPIKATPVEALHIGINTFNRNRVSDQQLARYETLLDTLRTAGAVTEDVCHPYVPQMKDIMRCEFAHDLDTYLADASSQMKSLAQIAAAYEAAPENMPYGITCFRDALDTASGNLDDPEYLAALSLRETKRAEFIEQYGDFDAFFMTAPTQIMHFLGFPSCTLRLCMGDDGIPRGVILYGTDEARLYGAALTIEQYCRPIEPPKL